MERRLMAAVGTLVFAAVLFRTAWISDDALIWLRTVLNVTHGFGLRFNIAARVQTYTHPLWILLLTVVYAIVGNVYVTTFAASIVCPLIVLPRRLTRRGRSLSAHLPQGRPDPQHAGARPDSHVSATAGAHERHRGHPVRAREKGFDTVVVAAVAGDDHYALGHLIVEGTTATDWELYRRVSARDGLSADSRGSH
jgi:hypothetical protein